MLFKRIITSVGFTPVSGRASKCLGRGVTFLIIFLLMILLKNSSLRLISLPLLDLSLRAFFHIMFISFKFFRWIHIYLILLIMCLKLWNITCRWNFWLKFFIKENLQVNKVYMPHNLQYIPLFTFSQVYIHHVIFFSFALFFIYWKLICKILPWLNFFLFK